MTQTPDTIDRIATAIGRPSRRTVARGAVWSLPAIAVGIAAPAQAASPGICPACTAGGPPTCVLSDPNGTGTCACGPELVCVGTGPLGLANVCVSESLLPLTDTPCGATNCTGVCLDPGGAAVVAVNTLVATLTTLRVTLRAYSLLGDTLRECNRLDGVLPTNVCVSPFNDGGLGSLCVEQTVCGGGTGALGAPLRATLDLVSAALTTLITSLAAAGIVATDRCQDPYVCRGGPSIALKNESPLSIRTFDVAVNVGICQCGPRDVCPDTFTVSCP